MKQRKSLLIIIAMLSVVFILIFAKLTIVCAATVVDKGTVYLVPGDKKTLKAPSTNGVSWTTTNNKVATVTKDGKVSTKTVGNTTIRAKAKGITYSYKLVVVDKSAIKLSPTFKNIPIDTTMYVNPTSNKYTAEQMKAMKLTYEVTSGDATIDKGYVKSERAGKFTVTAYLHKKKVCSVNMKAIILEGVNEKEVHVSQHDSIYITLKDIHSKLSDFQVFEIGDDQIADVNVETEIIDNVEYVKRLKVTGIAAGETYVELRVQYVIVSVPIIVGISPVQAVKTQNYTGYNELEQQTLKKIRYILDSNNLFSTSMSDKEKVTILQEYLMDNTKNSDYNPYPGEICSLIIGGVGHCSGYAMTMCFFCDVLDIPCHFVTGETRDGQETDGHAWNRVNLNGEWYYLDPTWVTGLKSMNIYFLTKTLWEDHIEYESDFYYDNFTTYTYVYELD